MPASRERMGVMRRLGLHTPQLRAWAMYDWANSGFATTIMAAVLPVYYAKVAAADLPEHVRTAYWGYTAAAGLAIVALLSPILGTIADTIGCKKKLLWWFMLAGAAASAGLWLVEDGDWKLASALYLIGNIGFAGSCIFYDSLLPFLADEKDVDRVSSAGYAIGYLGGGLLLAVNLAWMLKPELFGFPDKGIAVRASFVSVAVWWILFTIPLMRRVQEPPVVCFDGEQGRSPIAVGFQRLYSTFKQVRRYRQVAIFLVAFWFFTDAIGTIIKMATIYGAEIGIGESHLIGALLFVQLLGIPCTFAFGMLADRIGTKASIMISLVVYTGICILGYFMTSPLHFWLLAVLVALVQGASQALSRSLYATMIPLSKASEFFGFISVSSRFAGIAGPVLFGVVAQLAGGSRISILLLISFFVVGMWMLAKVDVAEGRRVAAEAERELVAARR